jgi:hypothetical protein
MANFSENLLKRLQELKMKPYRLAKLSGLNIQHCYKIVSGERIPSDDTLKKIAAVSELNLPLDQLKGWRDLDKCTDLQALVVELPEAMLIEELIRRYPDADERQQKIMGYADKAQ